MLSTADGWGQLADGAGAIVNLAGEGIADGRWSEERKKRIYASRINAGKAVVEAIAAAAIKPKSVNSVICGRLLWPSRQTNS